MGIAEDRARALAEDVIAQMEATNDIDLPREVSKLLAASSQPTEEAFNAAIRVLMAEKRARVFLEERRKNPPAQN
ncbi:MAG: hypothetical protein CSA72_13520 [Rhodobacterales bacterium]|nr:MAG: hypothetical protein CSA72_13520 [Rhodobacterales bacterium]